MGAFELPLLIIAWTVAICLVVPVALTVLVVVIGFVASLWIKYTDSNSLLDKVKSPKPEVEVKPISVKQTKPQNSVGFNADYENKIYEAKCRKEITSYINANYYDKYPTFKNFDIEYKEFSNVLILKDKDGYVLGKEEISLLDLWKLREDGMRKQRVTYSDLLN